LPNPPATRSSQHRRTTALLAIGAGAGLALAAWGLLGDAASARLPEGAVARVNGTAIRVEDFERLLAAVLRDMRTPDRVRARKRVLDRMIEEELLVQRAIDLGLVHLDRKVRADLTSNVIASVVNDFTDRVPSGGELADFFAENKDYFTRPGRLRAREIYFRNRDRSRPQDPALDRGSAQERAASAYTRLTSGDSFEQVKAELGDFEISPIPNALLPAAKLREYVGPTLLRTIGALEVGEWSKPTPSGSAIRIVQLIDREPATTPALEEIREQVEIDWRRRLGDRALRQYLDELRTRAKIEIAEGFE
jgi:parvulin-like peptidyl-prolyl isomerase